MTRYEKALVLGLGSSGVAAAELLVREGTRVTVIDKSTNEELLKKATELKRKGVDVGLGVVSPPDEAFDVCITSPGIASDSEWIRTIEGRSVEVLAELELGATRCKCPMVAITGSNGKSTLVKLCGEALAAGGSRVEMAGNYGIPLSDFAARSGNYDWVVVEVSSFQLEKVKSFKPRVGVLLNVNPNHLNRHGDLATYMRMKSRLFTAMDQQDTGVISDANAETIKTLSGGRCRWISFGRSVQADYRYKNGAIHYRRRNERHAISVTGSLFANDIMGTSAAAATAVLEACGLGGRYVENAVGDFEALPHRMNHVGTIDNVMFIDDSKATNISAMVAALEMCDRPVRLIAGGLLKEGDLAPAEKVLATKVRGLYLIGSAAQKMAEAWGCAVPCHLCERLDVALSKAWKDCSPGEAVLLSPACASFDQFSSFEERGDRFVQLVGKIREEK